MATDGNAEVEGGIDAVRGARRRLERRGLILGAEAALAARRIAVAPLVLVAAYGVAKVTIGLSQQRPVMALVLLVAGTLALVIWRLVRPDPVRSADGQRAFDALRGDRAAFVADPGLALAIFGASGADSAGRSNSGGDASGCGGGGGCGGGCGGCGGCGG